MRRGSSSFRRLSFLAALTTASMTSLGQAILLSSTVVKQANPPITSSPTLVLIHGLDSTRFTWNPFIERCAGKYNIVALDLRGHGESSLGDHPIASFSAAAIAAASPADGGVTERYLPAGVCS